MIIYYVCYVSVHVKQFGQNHTLIIIVIYKNNFESLFFLNILYLVYSYIRGLSEYYLILIKIKILIKSSI